MYGPLQLAGILDPGFVVGLVVLVLIVAFGSYVGVLMALQSFFGVDSWQDLDVASDARGTADAEE